ncbi:T9SS type A sorting domain-containing protein [Mangrovimonas sp. TPBH4]|nr:T9SS type A sorting domain-containing protein [Mangrovimonas sp. TPBH4]
MLLGAEVGKGVVTGNEAIDVSNYPNGMYFIQLENGEILKFIKN